MRHFYQQPSPRPRLLRQIMGLSHTLNSAAHLQPLIEKTRGAKEALLGETSPRTFEYYSWRPVISQILIKDHSFTFIVVDGDWSEGYELDRPEVQSDLKNADFCSTWMRTSHKVLKPMAGPPITMPSGIVSSIVGLFGLAVCVSQ